jgi:hypothetical protein
LSIIKAVTTLVRPSQPEDRGLDELQSRLAELEAALAARVSELERLNAELFAFKVKYRQEVGLLHEQLDELEAAIAQAELGEINRRLDEAQGEAGSPAAIPGESLPRFSTDAVRRLFRDVAKAIHPDLARDAQTRDRRHSFMIEANRAYALGDEERLRAILEAWERSPEAVQGSDDESARLRLVRRITQIDKRLQACATELAELEDSPLWKLKVMVDEASSRGKDLVSDMVRRLKRDILVARNRLDAMQSLGPERDPAALKTTSRS